MLFLPPDVIETHSIESINFMGDKNHPHTFQIRKLHFPLSFDPSLDRLQSISPVWFSVQKNTKNSHPSDNCSLRVLFLIC